MDRWHVPCIALVEPSNHVDSRALWLQRGEVTMSIKQKIDDAADVVADKAKDAKNAVVDAAGVVGDKAKKAGAKVKDAAQDAAHTVGQKVKGAGEKIKDQAE